MGIVMTNENWERTKRLYANIGKLITSSLEINEILEGIMKEIKIFFNPDNWSLMRLDHNTGKLYFNISEGIDSEAVKHIRINPGEGVAGKVAQTGKSIYVADTSLDSQFSDKIDKITGFKTKSIIAVPITFCDKVYGVIEIINRDSNTRFTEDEHLILTTIADFSAIAFANSYLYEQTLNRAITDPLTGLLNHTKLNNLIEDWKGSEDHLRRHEDTNSRIIVIFIDLDNFKDINDNYGHMEGDRVLKAVSRGLEKKIRDGDYLFRIGGDEFLSIIKTSTLDSIENILERIEDELNSVTIKSVKNNYNVSFSYGISMGPLHEIDELIKKADLNMYDRKNKRKTDPGT
jgi:diguanylate cyclase (GGDEF)-like protein